MFPELKWLTSPDLEQGTRPPNPKNCSIFLEAGIGSGEVEGADIFGFTVVTPAFVAKCQEKRWGRGYLLLPEFTWEEVEQALSRLLSHCVGASWQEIAGKLNRELLWEFDGYRD